MAGTTRFGGALIYAPDALVNLQGVLPFAGAIVARKVIAPSSILFDNAYLPDPDPITPFSIY